MRYAEYSWEYMLNLFLKISNKGQAMDMLRDSWVGNLIQNTPAFQMSGFPKLTYILSAKMLYWSNKHYLCYQLQREVLVVGISRCPVLRLMPLFCPEYSEEDKEEVGSGPFEKEIHCYWHKNKRSLSVHQWVGSWFLMAFQCIQELPKITGHGTAQTRIRNYDPEVSFSKVTSFRFNAKVIFVCYCFWKPRT